MKQKSNQFYWILLPVILGLSGCEAMLPATNTGHPLKFCQNVQEEREVLHCMPRRHFITVSLFLPTYSPTISMSWTSHLKDRAQREKVRQFIEINIHFLAGDISRGEGEYLKNFSTLLKMPDDELLDLQWRSTLKDKIAILFPKDQRDPDIFLKNLKLIMMPKRMLAPYTEYLPERIT